MSPIATIAEIGKHEGQTVTIRGWLYNLRESGKLLFPIFRDGSGQIQGVVPKNAVSPEIFDCHQRPDARVERHRRRKSSRRQTRARWIRTRRSQRSGRATRSRSRSLSHHSQRARHRLPDGSSPSLAALASGRPRSCASEPRLSRPRATSSMSADSR